MGNEQYGIRSDDLSRVTETVVILRDCRYCTDLVGPRIDSRLNHSYLIQSSTKV
jgi:hypothetical protein